MPLQLSKYNVSLKRLQPEDIEEVRYWRNQAEIRSQMVFQEIISKEMQKDWFKTINNNLNYYFTIRHNNETLGLINSKDVNLQAGFGEGGLFIWNKKPEYDFIPSLASLILLEFTFQKLSIFDLSYVRILNSNKRAIQYNKQLGYILIPNQNVVDNPIYLLTKTAFNNKSARLFKGANLLCKTNSKLQVTGSKSPLNLPEINDLL